MEFELNTAGTLLVAVIVLLIGRFIQEKVPILKKFFIPPPVIGGFNFFCYCYNIVLCKMV